ncbi:MAG TPA: DUF4331 family protein [Nitrospiraceae bacterium]
MGLGIMFASTRIGRQAVGLVGALAILLLSIVAMRASDHADTPFMFQQMRSDANISDFWVFVRGSNLVLALGTNPSLPAGVMEFIFPTDVTYRISIDRDSAVAFKDCDKLAAFGGCISKPQEIHEDIVFEITFDDKNKPQLRAKGFSADAWRDLEGRIQLFSGPRAEAFIFVPFVKFNIAAIVLEVPLDAIRKDQDTLLLWATLTVETFSGTFQDHVGRALRSQFNQSLNPLHPKFHVQQLGVPPDVLIFNTRAPVKFPNGRELGDDVTDILAEVGEGQARAIETSKGDRSATIHDVKKFLDKFPYLAPPQ